MKVMKMIKWIAGVLSAVALANSSVVLADRPAPPLPKPPPGAPPQEALQPMNFFITSVGMGKGANLGGLAGADAHCQKLAAAVGRGKSTWRAYLSTQGPNAVNARDRIGKGPFYNAQGLRVGNSVEQIHGDTIEDARAGVAFGQWYSLNEKAEYVEGDPEVTIDALRKHHIITGSTTNGRAYPEDGKDHTCSNYTNDGSRPGSAQLAHFDKQGGITPQWNSSHPSRGCSQDLLGGYDLLYCFAVD